MTTVDHTQQAHLLIDQSESEVRIVHAYDAEAELHDAMRREAHDFAETRDQDGHLLVEYWGGGDLEDEDTDEPRGEWRVHLHSAR